MVVNKKSLEGPSQLSEEISSLKNRHVNKYANLGDTSELSDDNKKYYVDDSQMEQHNNDTQQSKASQKSTKISPSKKRATKVTLQQNVSSSKKGSQTSSMIGGSGFQHNRKYINAIAVFFALYYCAQMYYRYQHRGWIGFADTFWLCNFTLVWGVFAIVLDKPFMMGMAVSCTAIVHSLWTIDAICGLTTGVFPIGNSEYIVWPDITWGEILTTTHHVWFCPLAIFTLHKNGGYPRKSWFGCMLLLLPVMYISALFPKTITLADGSDFYLNINLAHEWWSDVRGWPFSYIPQEPYLHYMIFFLSFCIFLFVVTHNIMKVMSRFLIDKY
ncbi:hypothetical protein DLAC_05082 [Tieghemostelium lacteum]|uniref:Transmembrane protein n=1 Tax=Tieghemostelium lacteum TaxID=361077 RepID=A0A151ZIL8_TIELA|nr:hypothetical protein DLAC_05082 [Tieghemostelium lacteum]|eukprot:KYQ93694.1 hypothetical protein DLAC_05082 [Tieghemostelium lacteum]